MKFIVECEALKEALPTVMGLTKGNSIPILSHILIEARGQSIKLVGNNLDSCSQVTLPAEVSAAGEIAIPADRLSRLVAGLPDSMQLTLDADDVLAKLRCGRSTYQFALLPPTDFPSMLEPKDPVTIELTAKQVARLFKMPSGCVADGKVRGYLAGIFLHHMNDRLAACATDGHTLLRVFVDVRPTRFEGVIVPDKSCHEFVRIAGTTDAKIEISPSLIAIEAGSRRFVSKLIDGTFPDYNRVIPQATAPFMTVDTVDMDGALARLLAACDPERAPTVKLHWNGEVGSIGASLATQFGQGEEQIECDCPGRDPGAVGAQIDFVRKLIDALGGKRTRFFIDGPGDPVRIENPDDPDIVAVVMPCRL